MTPLTQTLRRLTRNRARALDEVALYSSPLSQATILAHYARR